MKPLLFPKLLQTSQIFHRRSFVTILLSALLMLNNGMFNSNAQTFTKGDLVMDLGIGFGEAQTVKIESLKKPDPKKVTTGIFNQRFSFEVGVIEFNSWKLGVGGIVANSYGFGVPNIATGKYDYSYIVKKQEYENSIFGWQTTETKDVKREGTVTSECKNHIEEIDVMLKISLHKEFCQGLDTYLSIAAGLCNYSVLVSSAKTPDNMAAEEKHLDFPNKITQYTYAYNDADHVKWQQSDASGRFAMAFVVGARYYFSRNWGIGGEIGLTSGSFKRDANVFNLISVGLCYKL